MGGLGFVFNLVFRAIILWLSFVVWLIKGTKRNKIPPIRDPLLLEPATVLAEKIRSQKIKSESVVKAYIERIRAVNPVLNAVVEDRFEKALEEARAADNYVLSSGKTASELQSQKPFLGVPFSVKEILSVEGLSLTSGLVWRKRTKASKDGAAVALMRTAGAIPICVTNVPQLCVWTDASNKLYGITKNPYDLNRTPGGSSGGEASLISSAGSVIGLGSDGGGSIRIPAFSCGIFGHKPTRKIVSRLGLYPPVDDAEIEQYFTIGPMCRYAADLLPMLKVLAGNNVSKLRLDKKVELKNLKVYYTEDYPTFSAHDRMNSDISLAVRKIVLHLGKTYGIPCKRVSVPALSDSWRIFMTKISAANLHESYGQVAKGGNTSMSLCLELLKSVFGLSKHTLHFLYFYGLLVLASTKFMKKKNADCHKTFAELTGEFQDLLGQDGVFIYPTQAQPATFHKLQIFRLHNVGYTSIFNLLGFPVTQCPTGTTWQGMPIGVQVVSGLHNDRLTLAVARELEVLYGGWNSPAPIL